MQARANFWIEIEGKVVLSSWRVRLLEAVEETGSISAAASKMHISYRRAWDKIHESYLNNSIAMTKCLKALNRDGLFR